VGEYYCSKHALEADQIRCGIIEIKASGARREYRQEEINLRQQEVALRKKVNACHYRFLLKLENNKP